MTDKFPKTDRTFETRLQFISYIFEERFPKYIIMASCVSHKLNWNYAQYLLDLNKKSKELCGRDPMKLLKKIEM